MKEGFKVPTALIAKKKVSVGVEALVRPLQAHFLVAFTLQRSHNCFKRRLFEGREETKVVDFALETQICQREHRLEDQLSITFAIGKDWA